MLHGKVSKYSQSNVLKDRMQEAGFTHGQQARVNLRGVQVEPTADTEGKVFFCKMKEIEVVEVLEKGDGGPLPEDAEVEDLYFPEKGTHDLSGVILSSNGRLQVKADRGTKVAHSGWFNSFLSLFQ